MSEEVTQQTTGDPVAEQQGQQPNGAPVVEQPPGEALSQEQANKLIGQARMAGRESAVKELLAELGVENLDSLKVIKQAQDEAAAANQTELEKAQKALDDAAKRAAAAEAENARIKREVGFRDAWAAAGKPAENLTAALKLVDWPDGEANFADLVKQTVSAFPVLDPEPAKPDTGASRGRGISAPAGPNPLHARWDGMLGVPVSDKE